MLFLFAALAVNFATGLPSDNCAANYVLLLTGIPASTTTPNSAEAYYVIFVIALACCLPGCVVCGRYPRPANFRQLACDLAALVFLIVWVYGLLLGWVLGNSLSFVIRNFAGMLFYIAYFILVCLRAPPEKVYKVTYWAALYVMLLTIVLSIAAELLNIDIDSPAWAFFSGPVRAGEASGHRRIFCANQLVLFVVASIALYRLTSLYFRRLLKSLLLAAIALYALFVPASRGYILGLIAIIAVLLMAAAAPLMRLRVSKRFLALLLFIALGAGVVIATGYDDIVLLIFSQEEGGNAIRLEQSSVLLDDCTLFGRGLGAVISSGYTRVSGLDYAFEVVYVNIFHKFGIFAVLLIACYLYTFYAAGKALVRKTIPAEHACCALGAMGYTLVAFGNPVLFAPSGVLLHCVALYLLRQPSSRVAQLDNPAVGRVAWEARGV